MRLPFFGSAFTASLNNTASPRFNVTHRHYSAEAVLVRRTFANLLRGEGRCEVIRPAMKLDHNSDRNSDSEACTNRAENRQKIQPDGRGASFLLVVITNAARQCLALAEASPSSLLSKSVRSSASSRSICGTSFTNAGLRVTESITAHKSRPGNFPSYIAS
jgi:hypothetical protein